jgi:hypothetical protein
MTQSSLGTTEQTTNIMKLLRNRTKAETKDFMDDFTNHLKIVLDTLEGTQKVFYQIEDDIVKGTVTVRFGSVLGINDLPQEVQKLVAESEEQLRAKEDGDGSNVVTVTYEGTISPKPTKPLEERIAEIYAQHPNPEKKVENQ